MNDGMKIRIIATGNSYGDKTFYVLYSPTVADITEEELIKCFGSDEYENKILGGSAIYTDDLSVKIWNEADKTFK